MRRITLCLKLFRSEAERVRSERALRVFLHGLAAVNLDYLREYPATPKLYQSGVRYQAEWDTEEWQDIPTTIERRYGDCEDLASWRIAELLAHGVKAGPFIRFRRDGNWLRYHVMVRHDSGRLEDPSRVLGMGRE